MNNLSGIRNLIHIVVLSLMLVGVNAAAQYQEKADPGSWRWEIWLALQSWPALGDLQPAAGGSFKGLGFGLGGAAHWPIRQLGNSEILLGIDAAITATDSDVPVLLDDLLARHLYVGTSIKWLLREARDFSLDAGLAYHLVDIAQLETDYAGPIEFESWEESKIGGFVGATWNIGAGRTSENSGLSLGLKVHFVDFGTVSDEAVALDPVLGSDAGELDGPIYVLQIAHSWR